MNIPPSDTTLSASGSVTVETLPNFHSKKLGNRRPVEIYLPPSYSNSTSPERRYKVLCANDGQDMVAVRLKENLEMLYAAGEIEELIVVAPHAAIGGRLQEYGTAGRPNSRQQGKRADRYTAFLLNELMPYINRTYRSRIEPASAGIMGWSLGGLSAFDVAWQHPEVFGVVGVFSGSFWWRTEDSSVAAKQASRIMHRLVRQSDKREGLRMWFEAGTDDETADRDNNGVIDAIQDTTELIDELTLKGYRPGQDMLYVEVKGGQHNPLTWGEVLPDFLKWAFPARPSRA